MHTVLASVFKAAVIITVLACAPMGMRASEPSPEEVAIAQQPKIDGKVIDISTGQPLAGARVSIVNAQVSAMTDDDGSFTLDGVPQSATLMVTAPGYDMKYVPVRGNANFDIKLSPTIIGNTYEGMLDATAVGSQEYMEEGLITADNAVAELQGNLLAITRSGMPGSGHAIYVDGLHSLNSSSQPLYVVDGVMWAADEEANSIIDGHMQNPLALISPEDIERIYVLKNGTAIYGARAGNGVVVIETKRAHNEATEIQAWAKVGWRSNSKRIPMMNNEQYRIYASDIIRGKYSNQTLINRLGFLNDDPTSSQYAETHNNTDWLDLVTRNGIIMDYGISVRGGDDRALYSFSLGYTKNDGTVKKTSFDRFNVRFNSDIKLWKGATLRFDVAYAQAGYKLFDDGLNAVSSPFYVAMIKSPLYHPNVMSMSGTPTLKYADVDELGVTNPLNLLDLGIGESKNYRFNLVALPRYQFNDKVGIEGLVAYTFDKVRENSFIPDYGLADRPLYNNNGEIYAVSRNVVKNLMNRRTRFTADLHVEYSPIKNLSHDLWLKGGFRYENNSYLTSYGEGHNTSSDYITDLSNTSSALHWMSGYDAAWRNMAWYLSAQYSWLKRYFLNVDMTLESSSKFGNNAPGALHMAGISWGYFPSINAAWLISSEKWMRNVTFINALKLRVGYDMAGNDNLPIYANRTYFQVERLMDNSFGQIISNLGNDKLKWETTSTLRVGLDASLFNDIWSFSFDFYKSKTTDLLVLKTLPEEAGIEHYWTNGGALGNTGIVFATNVRAVNTRDWHLDLGATIGHYKNKVTKLDDGDFVTDVCGGHVLTAVGQPVGVFYGYKTDGVLIDSEAANKANLSIRNADGSYTKFGAGDMRFVDNGDGVINSQDMQIIGNPNPDFYGNFNFKLSWRNLSLYSLFTYSVGNDVYNALRANIESGSDIYNQTTAMAGRWVANGQQTEIPRATYGDPMGNSRFSDRWIEDGSYLKWKSLQLEYDIPIRSTVIQGVSLSFAVKNLLTFTKYLGLDPEFSFGNSPLYMGVDAAQVAQAREFNFGVKINL